MEFAGKRFLFSPPLPLPAASISVALAPIFAQPKSEKRLQRMESPTETLATQATNNMSGTVLLQGDHNTSTFCLAGLACQDFFCWLSHFVLFNSACFPVTCMQSH